MIHGGSSIFVHNQLEANEVEELRDKSAEGHIECSSVVSRPFKMIIICIYRPPQGDLNIFFTTLSDILNTSLNITKNYKLILCGDFNIDLLRDTGTTKTFRDLLQSFNLNQTIYQPTRITSNSVSLIDNIFINDPIENQSQVINNTLSDHEGQLLKVSVLAEPTHDTISYKRRVFSKAKLQQFKDELIQINWQNVYNSKDVNESYQNFYNKINYFLNLIFPLKTVKQSENQKTKLWITQGIKTSAKNKRNLHKKMRNGDVSIEHYKIYSKILKQVIREAKKNLNKNYIRTAENPGKAIWQLVDKYTGKKSKKQDSVLKNLQLHNEKPPKEILNEVNNFYVKACPELNIDYNCATQNIKSHKNSLFLYPTDNKEVYSIIMNLKNKKSVGYDEIPVTLLKYVAAEISMPLVYIINLSLSNGIFPEQLKIAQIKPIYKKGDKSSIKNYRPIALLSNISKIFEKIIYERLSQFLENKKLLSEYQNGFRKKKSTTRAIYQAISKILESLNSRKNTIAICLDLSKAFDSVDHELLLFKLEKYGIRGTSFNLLKSYLRGRKQNVIEYDEAGNLITSNTEIVRRGVPQGSILGPLLYIIYTNELPNIVIHNSIQFADDTSIILTLDQNINMNEEIFETLSSLEKWFSSNNLLLNVEKTNLIKFSYRTSDTRINFVKNEKTIETTQTTSFLGIKIDYRLDWKYHIDCLAKTISKYCYALKILTQNINEETAVIAYHAYVHSQIRYGIIFWANSTEANRIFILQKRCLRNLFNLKKTETCRQKFRENKILTLTSTYIYESVIFIKENSTLFKDCDRGHQHDTRYKDDMNNMKSTFTYIQRNVQYSIIKIFNKIPVKLRSLDIRAVKRKLKSILIKKAYYTLDEFYSDKNFNLE